MELLRSAARLVSRAAFCSCSGREELPTLRWSQRNLAFGEVLAAWEAAEELREECWRPRQPLELEAIATHGVAAAATGRYVSACEAFRAGRARAASAGDKINEELFACLLARAELLMAMSLGERDPSAGPWWRAAPPPPVQAPLPWASWLLALPTGAEFVGPVEIRWLPSPEASGQRGLFATRAVEAGEVLLVAQPLARGADVEKLCEALRQSSRCSARTRRNLAALASASRLRPMPPKEAQEALLPAADESLPAAPGGAGAPGAGEEDIPSIVDRNAMRIGGRCELYGLPSILNNACDSHGANAMRLRLDHIGGMLAFVAARRIEVGEELRHYYADLDGPRLGKFACSCRRCTFEAQDMPGTPEWAAMDAARRLFAQELRPQMRRLQADLDARTAGPRPLRVLWEILERLLAALQSVEDALQAGRWGGEERAWCLASLQPLLSASVWCFLRQAALGAEAEAAAIDQDVSMVLWLRTLSRLATTWQHTRRLGPGHLRSLQMLWSAADEARVRAVAKLAAVDSVGLPGSSAASMRGEDFFAAARSQGLRALLKRSGGLIRVSGVLPTGQAEEAYSLFTSIEGPEWVLSANVRNEDADHRVWRYEGARVDWIRRCFKDLAPGMHPDLNAAKYDGGGRIALHNDARSWEVEVASPGYPEGTEVHRKIALIFYLTKDWRESYGGVLVDNMRDGPEKVVPEFNSMVCFLVPREHWVTEVAQGAPMQYSLFGWFSDTKPYPPRCQPLLGSGNWCPRAKCTEKAAQVLPPRSVDGGSDGPTDEADLLPPAGATLSAQGAVALAAATKRRCEAAFKARFGIPPEKLRLGKANSQVSRLLERLKGSE